MQQIFTQLSTRRSGLKQGSWANLAGWPWIYGLKNRGNFLVHRFIGSFIRNLWLTIGHELHKIRWRDRKIPISKIGQRAWQNQTDSKNWTDFGCSCKWGVTKLTFTTRQAVCAIDKSIKRDAYSLEVHKGSEGMHSWAKSYKTFFVSN